MNLFMKKYLYILILLFLFLPSVSRADTAPVGDAPAIDVASGTDQSAVTPDETFEAKVVKVLEEKTIKRDNGATAIQQNLELVGLAGKWKDKVVVYHGIGDIDVLNSLHASVGDKVIVSYSKNEKGEDVYYVTDFVRRGNIYLLAIVFCLLLFFIGRWQGVKSLISLIVSFLIIMKLMIPWILSGVSPLLVSIFGAFLMLIALMYITWGVTRKATLAIVSMVISLLITGLISILFTNLTKLSGGAQEEIMFLSSLNVIINFRGLLLAGIIIGTLGVLDDIVIGQISAVEQLREAGDKLTDKEIYKRAIRIGIDHMSSMTNTLFLAYAGASLPLLLLFSINKPPFTSFSQVINNEMIATEIVRTLVGSIGLILALPIATYLAVKFIKIRKQDQQD